MTKLLTQLGCAVLAVFCFSTFAVAQVTSTLSGTVVDSGGAVIPGAAVIVTNKSTTATFNAVTDGTGTFSVPALNPGLYSVSVSLSGFKTAVLDDVRLQPGIPTALKATLEVGGLEETVVVSSGESLVNTSTPVIAATLSVDQINDMPLPTRNALNAVTFLPGVNTSGINRDANVNGLPESFINITLDGVANNDQFNKTTDGFFASVTPRQDAVEAVTVTMGVGGADVGGHGAIGINFVTRSGSNRFTGSAYEYHRSPRFNTNYWFNERNGLPKNDVVLNQYGVRQGGPILIPGVYDGRNKAFFFVNYEEVRLPNNFSRTRTVLDPRAQQGWFRYNVTVGGQPQVREVNVLQLAAANGQLSTIDPTIARVLGFINDSAQQDARLNLASDPLLNEFIWQSPGNQTEKQPVLRLDFNLSQNHRLSGTFNQIWVVRDPDQLNNSDRRFPASTNYGKYVSTRPSRSIALRSTLGANLVSELRGGITRGGGSFFGQDETNGVPTFSDTGGFALDLDADNALGAGLTNWHVENEPTWRSGYSYSLDETLTWMKGKHTITTGAAMFLGRTWANGQTMVPEIDLGFDQTQDPANSMFTTTAFQGASTAQLTDARALYAMLTGRVRAITGEAALDENNQYVAFGPRFREGNMDEYSAFVQDSWRVTPSLTLNAGVRWDVQLPFSPSNDIMTAASIESICGISGVGSGDTYNACNFFNPNARGGVVPQFDQLTKGSSGYKTDWNNVAPNIGLAWQPRRETGFWRKILGDPDQATIRAGYSVAYERQGLGVFTGQFGENPGSTLSLTRDVNTGIVGPGETWPVLLREPDRLYNAPFPQTPTFPIPIRANRADNIEGFHPDIEIASARTFMVSLQRAITNSTAVEVRYVGTLGVNQWSEINYNERNVVENGFLDEFKLAMANLQANNAAGGARLGSFAYFGSGSGTNPLPIYLAYLNGSRDAGNPAAYTGGANTWTNSTLAGRLVRTNPQPNQVLSTTAFSTGTAYAAADLDNNLTRRNNAQAAGYPANFFVVNPHANQVNINDSGAFSSYHAIQAEVRRRLSRGLQVNASYQYALEEGSTFLGFHFGRASNPANASVRHAIKAQWDWALPVGRGERFGSDAHPLLNGIIGGWQFNGVGRVQARTADFGNVRLVGMTKEDVQKMYKWDVRIDPATGLRTVYTMPDDVILNTRRAFSTSSTSLTGYSDLGVPQGRYFAPANSADCIQIKAGDCAPRNLVLRAPFFTRFDVGVTKRFPINGRVNFELRADVLNVFDNINFTVTDASRQAGTAATIYQTNAAYSDLNNTFDPGGRIGQLVFRLNW
jgi:Carboxypeptidase regulatory-like domain/TonB dependent receptor